MKRTGFLLVLLTLICGIAYVGAQAPPPVPALPDSPRITGYSLSGSTCNCSVGFAIYGDGTDVDNWLDVFVNGVSVLSTDPAHAWSLSSATGALGSIPRPITNAVLTFAQPQTGTVAIVGARRPRRTTQFQENRGVTARDLNQAFTDLTAMERERWDAVNGAIRGQPGEVLYPLPTAASRANTALGFDASGQPVVCSAGGTCVGSVPPPGTPGAPLFDFQALLTAAGATGGLVSLPCGTYVVNTATTLAIAAGKSVTVAGQGLCTTLAFQGVNATSITLGDVFSSIRWGHMRVTTTGFGNFTGLAAHLNGNPVPVFATQHVFEDLQFIGDDYASGSPAHYWGVGLSLIGLTNVSIDNVTSIGISGLRSGTGVLLSGQASLMAYSVVINFKHFLSLYHDVGIDYETFTQGISIVSSNFQSNNVGVKTAGAGTGLSQLAIVNSQFGDNTMAGLLIAANVGELSVANSLFEMGAGQIGIEGTGFDFNIVGNTFLAQQAASGVGIGIALTSANGFGTIASNNFTNLASGINADAGSTYAMAKITNNIHIGSTLTYQFSGGTNLVIDDNQPTFVASLPTCNSTIQGSTMTVINNNTAVSYRGAVTAGGSTWSRVFCPPTGAWVQN